MSNPQRSSIRSGFTLVELLTVIAIIAVLMGILFPTINSAIESAKKTQAKNDELQIVNAIKGYYTEYGKYPVEAAKQGTDAMYGDGGSGPDNKDILYVLRAVATGTNSGDTLNPRKIVFLEVPFVKKDTVGKRKSGLSATDGNFYDPWGNQYVIGVDASYNNLTRVYTLSYTDLSYQTDPSEPGNLIPTGVICASYGRDGKIGNNGTKTFKGSDDVISWQ